MNPELILDYKVQLYTYKGRYFCELSCTTPKRKGEKVTWTRREDTIRAALAAAYLKLLELQGEMYHE